jgi:hypothetical protein
MCRIAENWMEVRAGSAAACPRINITSVRMRVPWLYRAAVMGLFSRKIVDWAITLPRVSSWLPGYGAWEVSNASPA